MKKKIHHKWNRKGPPDCALGVIISTHLSSSKDLMSMRYLSDTFMSDRYLIDVDPRVFAIWVVMFCYDRVLINFIHILQELH